MFLLNGRKIESLIEVPLTARIIVASPKKYFEGIEGKNFLLISTGLEKIE